jgi:hypothetical protein
VSRRYPWLFVANGFVVLIGVSLISSGDTGLGRRVRVAGNDRILGNVDRLGWGPEATLSLACRYCEARVAPGRAVGGEHLDLDGRHRISSSRRARLGVVEDRHGERCSRSRFCSSSGVPFVTSANTAQRHSAHLSRVAL